MSGIHPVLSIIEHKWVNQAKHAINTSAAAMDSLRAATSGDPGITPSSVQFLIAAVKSNASKVLTILPETSLNAELIKELIIPLCELLRDPKFDLVGAIPAEENRIELLKELMHTKIEDRFVLLKTVSMSLTEKGQESLEEQMIESHEKMGITHSEYRQFINSMAQFKPETFIRYYNGMKLDKEEKVPLLINFVRKNPELLAKSFKELTLTPEIAFLIIAGLAEMEFIPCEDHPFAVHFKNFNLSEKDSFPLIRSFAAKNPVAFTKHYKNFKIPADKELSLLRKLANKHPEHFATFFQKLHLPYEDVHSLISALVDIKAKDVENHPFAVHFKSFKLKKEDAFFLVQALADSCPESFAKHFKTFEMVSPNKVIRACDYSKGRTLKLIQDLAKYHPKIFADSFDNFDLLKTEASPLIKNLAQDDPKAFIENFEKFSLNTVTALPLLQYAFKKIPLVVFAQNFYKFHLSEKVALHFIQEITKKDPSGFLNNFEKLSLSKSEALPLVIYASKKDPEAFLDNFEKFSLPKSDALPLILYAYQKGPEAFLDNFEKLSLTKSEALPLLLYVSKEAPKHFILKFKTFQLTTKEARPLLTQFIEAFPNLFATYIKYFDLSPEDALPLLTQLAQNYPDTFLRNLQRFELADKERISLICSAANKDLKSFGVFFKKLNLPHEISLSLIKKLISAEPNQFILCLKNNDFKLTHEELLPLIQLLATVSPEIYLDHFEIFNLTSDNAFKLLEKVSKKAPEHFFKNFQKFELSIEKAAPLLESIIDKAPEIFAKNLPKIATAKTIRHPLFKNFIDKHSFLFLNCANDYLYQSSFRDLMDSFSKKDLLEFVDFLMENHPKIFISHISLFTLNDGEICNRLLDFTRQYPLEIAAYYKIASYYLSEATLHAIILNILNKEPTIFARNFAKFDLSIEKGAPLLEQLAKDHPDIFHLYKHRFIPNYNVERVYEIGTEEEDETSDWGKVIEDITRNLPH